MNGKKTCYYEVLNVTSKATEDEIKKAYRVLALKWHPDKNLDDTETAEEKFKQIGEAYSILSNEDKRSKYDRFGFKGVDDSMPDFEDADDLFYAFFGDGNQDGFLNADDLAFLMAASAKSPKSRKRAGRRNRGGTGGAGLSSKGMDKMMEGMLFSALGSMMFPGAMPSKHSGMDGLDDFDEQMFAEMAGFASKGKKQSKKSKKEDDGWEDDTEQNKGRNHLKSAEDEEDWEDD